MPDKQPYDAIVLGVGGIGSAALYQLALRGASVLGIERFDVAHSRGSSHGDTRVIRKAYFEHPDYVPLLERAYQLWQTLDAPQPLFHPCGVLSMGSPKSEIISGIQTAARMHHLPIEVLSPTDIKARYPGLVPHPDHVGLLESDGGYLMVEDAIRFQVKEALRLGARCLTNTRVESWNAKAGHNITVHTSQGTFETAQLIITAGAWAGDFLTHLQSKFKILRKHLHWFGSEDRQMSDLPIFFFALPDGLFYGFPQIDQWGVKVANHAGGESIANPLKISPAPDSNDLATVRSFCAEHLPTLGGQQRHEVCMYTQSPDGHFVVDRHPEYDNVFFTAGLSGHGYKFAPVLGEILAQLALDNKTPHPIDFLSAKRLF